MYKKVNGGGGIQAVLDSRVAVTRGNLTKLLSSLTLCRIFDKVDTPRAMINYKCVTKGFFNFAHVIKVTSPHC
jgi:hypothetical protein